MPLPQGTRLGPYEVLAPLGAGGMGEVYRARDSRLARDVALKILPRDFATDSDRRTRFEREARAAGQIHHPNILTILDIGAHDGLPFIVTELLEGETLRERLLPGPLPQRKAMEIASQIARGLGAAHERRPTGKCIHSRISESAVRSSLAVSPGLPTINAFLPLWVKAMRTSCSLMACYTKNFKIARTLEHSVSLDAKCGCRYTVSSSRLNCQRTREDRGADAEVLHGR